MSRIYWDTMLFVYWFEDRGDSLCSSVFTVSEALSGPYKRGAVEVASEIRDFLRPPEVALIPFTIETADRYARVRADHRVSPPDAIHLASAAQAGVELFLTNDHCLQGLVIPGTDHRSVSAKEKIGR